MSQLTSAQAESLLAEPKVIYVNLTWRPEARGFKLQATVLSTASGETLSLRGYVGPKNRSLALLYQNLPIRKLTVHDWHPNPNGEKITGPHKHTWDDKWQDQVAYIPTDIAFGDPNEELIDFLQECGIRLGSAYTPMLFIR